MIVLNLTEIKQDFYKRYNASDNFLHFTSNGLLCVLLGCCDIENAPSLSCTLSMRVQMLARKLDSNIIKIQDADTNKCLSYIPGTSPELFQGMDRKFAQLISEFDRGRLRGAEILYKSTIPKFLPETDALLITLAQSLLKVSNIEMDKKEIAALASISKPVTSYLCAVSSRSGYCTLSSGTAPRNYPLPLSGYKIVSAHCTEKDKDRTKPVKYAFEKIRHLYPHAASISDITADMFTAAKSSIKDKTALRYMYHLVNENSRIESAASALKRCNTRALFREMNNSCKSMERFWDIGSEHRFLASCADGIDGVEAARYWHNGIIMIVENDRCDYAIDMIKSEFENNIGYQPTFCISEAV